MGFRFHGIKQLNIFSAFGEIKDLNPSYSFTWKTTTRMVKKKVSSASKLKDTKKDADPVPVPVQSGSSSSSLSQHGSISVSKDGSLAIAIQVKPGSKQDAITVSEDHIGVQISAPPVDGEANSAIIKYFSQVLNVKKNEIELKGGKSRQKSIIIQSGCITATQALENLKKEQNNA